MSTAQNGTTQLNRGIDLSIPHGRLPVDANRSPASGFRSDLLSSLYAYHPRPVNGYPGGEPQAGYHKAAYRQAFLQRRLYRRNADERQQAPSRLFVNLLLIEPGDSCSKRLSPITADVLSRQ